MKELCFDISTWQGGINYNDIRNRVNFAILRAGFSYTKDNRFEEHYANLHGEGMHLGAYWYSYATSPSQAKAEARLFLQTIKGKEFDLPIYLDVEAEELKTESKENLNSLIDIFNKQVEKSGNWAGIYANLDWFKNKLEYNELKNYKIWLAEWNVTKPTIECDLWQYTDNLIINNKRFDCSYIINENEDEKEGEFEVKDYENGSTIEYVYQDDKDLKQIGYLHPYETAKCYGIVNNRALIVYTVDGTTTKKSGFVKWLGGIK